MYNTMIPGLLRLMTFNVLYSSFSLIAGTKDVRSVEALTFVQMGNICLLYSLISEMGHTATPTSSPP